MLVLEGWSSICACMQWLFAGSISLYTLTHTVTCLFLATP